MGLPLAGIWDDVGNEAILRMSIEYHASNLRIFRPWYDLHFLRLARLPAALSLSVGRIGSFREFPLSPSCRSASCVLPYLAFYFLFFLAFFCFFPPHSKFGLASHRNLIIHQSRLSLRRHHQSPGRNGTLKVLHERGRIKGGSAFGPDCAAVRLTGSTMSINEDDDSSSDGGGRQERKLAPSWRSWLRRVKGGRKGKWI